VLRAGGEDGWPGLLFFCRLGEGLLLGGVGEQAGDEAVGELSEGLVDVGLELAEGGRVTSKLFRPQGLLGLELAVDLLEGLVRRGQVRARLGVGADAHGKSFRVKLLLPAYNSPSDGQRHHFFGMDPVRFLFSQRDTSESLADWLKSITESCLQGAFDREPMLSDEAL
jgi:hypothetical protein